MNISFGKPKSVA